MEWVNGSEDLAVWERIKIVVTGGVPVWPDG